ncbi:MAG: peptide/nickel transport system ATP-binding protein [Thermotogota bacterium]|nr:peptide/nickel transport system ATP-binding protein [Thermotogota bacterium]MDK2864937.1 peptide/nickel transport system ATP-binding protein [Thermotogota bacterium]
MKHLVRVENLKKIFKIRNQGRTSTIVAVDDVSFFIKKGETLGLIGESGSGKTTVGRMIVRLLEPSEGRIEFDSRDITHLKERELKPFRNRFQIVFQDPYSSLNPRMTVFQILSRPLSVFGVENDRRKQKERVLKALYDVGLHDEHLNRYPHEFSGGQRQRISIARALISEPEFVVLDEPTSALDVSVQAQILNLLKYLKSEHNLTYLFISHDLGVIHYMCDRVMVMYLGEIVESASTEELFESPIHPYTRFLMRAIPDPDPEVSTKELEISYTERGSQVSHSDSGCKFFPRCDRAIKRCEGEHPELVEILPEHYVRCHNPHL